MSFRTTNLTTPVVLTTEWQPLYSEVYRVTLNQVLLQFNSNSVLVRFTDDDTERMLFDLDSLDNDFGLGVGATTYLASFVHCYSNPCRWVWTFPGRGWVGNGSGLKIEAKALSTPPSKSFMRGIVLWSEV